MDMQYRHYKGEVEKNMKLKYKELGKWGEKRKREK